ncbi:hypothetical protein PInf_017754 [Phytophthora infestans]|nr:hypothetical protein PInf_017754 [Phytophthora infestans]
MEDVKKAKHAQTAGGERSNEGDTAHNETFAEGSDEKTPGAAAWSHQGPARIDQPKRRIGASPTLMSYRQLTETSAIQTTLTQPKFVWSVSPSLRYSTRGMIWRRHSAATNAIHSKSTNCGRATQLEIAIELVFDKRMLVERN